MIGVDWNGAMIATTEIKELAETLDKFSHKNDTLNMRLVGKQIQKDLQELLDWLGRFDTKTKATAVPTTMVKRRTTVTDSKTDGSVDDGIPEEKVGIRPVVDEEWEKVATRRCGRHG